MNEIDPSGLIGHEFRYKSKYGGVIYDTIKDAWIVYDIDVSTVDRTKPARSLMEAIQGPKINGRIYNIKGAYAHPKIMIKSSNGISYEFNESITIKIL